jgi:nucleoside-diphosphate-sugar epimerase
MRVAVTGATGNLGTSLLPALAGDASVDEIVGIVRRRPDLELPKTTWAEADVASDDLVRLFRGADAVVHLAWLIQPSRNQRLLRETNLLGSRRVFRAVAKAKVPVLVYASSIGAYSPGPKDRPVDESWPTDGILTSPYARQKATVERMLDSFEQEHPEVRSVRFRPGLMFKREASTGIRRLFLGPLLPNRLVRQKLPVFPKIQGLVFQCLHTDDAADAFRRAILGDSGHIRGPFNLAADPPLDLERVARIFGARPFTVPAPLVRGAAAWSWRLNLQPADEGWFDMAMSVPVMDTSRARRELGWEPEVDAPAALEELVAGIRDGADFETPPLAHETSGPARMKELATGIGRGSQ